LLVTHSDTDHYDQELLRMALEKGKKVVVPEGLSLTFTKGGNNLYQLKSGETININNIKITAYQTDHRGDNNFLEPNVWYLIETGGFKFLHTGDGREFKNNSEKLDLYNNNIDICFCNLMLHPYTIRDIHPSILIPLHLFKFMQNKESLMQSTFSNAINLYAQYQDDLTGIKIIYLFPGESFIYP